MTAAPPVAGDAHAVTFRPHSPKAAGDEQAGGDNGSLVRSADKLILMGQRGRLSLGRATPERFELLSTAKVFDPERNEVWSTP